MASNNTGGNKGEVIDLGSDSDDEVMIVDTIPAPPTPRDKEISIIRVRTKTPTPPPPLPPSRTAPQRVAPPQRFMPQRVPPPMKKISMKVPIEGSRVPPPSTRSAHPLANARPAYLLSSPSTREKDHSPRIIPPVVDAPARPPVSKRGRPPKTAVAINAIEPMPVVKVVVILFLPILAFTEFMVTYFSQSFR